MPEKVTETIPYEDTRRILGIELDDGTFIENYETEVQVDDGTPFAVEFIPRNDDVEYDVFGRGELTLITQSKLQRWYDEGRLEILD